MEYLTTREQNGQQPGKPFWFETRYMVGGNVVVQAVFTEMYKKGTAGSACPAGYTSDDGGLCSGDCKAR